MNVFDVLREKLETEKNSNPSLMEQAEYYRNGLDEAIKFVNQVEQEQGFTPCYLGGPCEYQNENVDLNTGWIPCSERLPETAEDVMCWYEYFRYGEYNRMFQTYGIGRYYKSHDFWDGEVSNGRNCRVIAWQPLPQPYYTEV